MMRRDVHRANATLAKKRSKVAGAQALCIDCNRQQLGTRTTKGGPRWAIAECFDRDRVAGTKQRVRSQIERLLAAVGDEHVVGGDGETSRRGKHRGQCRAKGGVASWLVGVTKQRATVGSGGATERATDNIEIDEPRVGHAAPQRDGARVRDCRWRENTFATNLG
jgi:hypothetical protein